MIKQFLENLKADVTVLSYLVLGCLVTGALYLESREKGFLLAASFFGIILLCGLVAAWKNSGKNDGKKV